MRIHVIMRYIGVVLLLNAVFMLTSLIISIWNHDEGVLPLLYSTLVTVIWGVFPMIFVPKSVDLNNREAYIVVVTSWILSCMFGLLPFLFWGGEFTFTKALFESVSGYTTTGASILNNIEALPKGLLFWRSSTHWIGGLGIVVFMLLVLPSLGKAQMLLSKMEISSLAHENFKFKTSRMLTIILSIYLGLTAICAALYVFFGMTPFDAINHAFSVISTGGFSTKNLSMGHFDSVPIEIVTVIFMFLSGIHFGLLFATFTFKKLNIFSSPVVRWYFFTTFIGAILIALNLHGQQYESWFDSFRYAIFQAVSISTTTGFANADSSIWPSFSITVLIFFTIQCACSGSTAGGLKVDRIVIFVKTLKCHILKLQHPQAQIPIKIGKKTISEDIASSAILFIVLYITIILISSIFISIMGVDLLTSFSASAASLGSSGPGFGLVGSISNYSCMPNGALLILCIDMLLGRLEIFGLLLLFTIFRWR